jgi:glycosyltransferase involved in cell wall biosynthesis
MSCVDIVIPCYKYAQYLRECVESVLSQTGVDVRVLIIDDASPDNTPEVCAELSSLDHRVEYIRHKTNQGPIATFNEGLLDWASSEYSLLISADDALAPGALSRATQLMDRHKDVGMTYGMAQVVCDPEWCPVSADDVNYESKIVPGAEFLRYCFIEGNAVATPTAVVRTDLQHRLGGYSANLPHSHDMEMWMRFAVNAPVGVIGKVQAFYRNHSQNMSSQYYSQDLGDIREVIQACDQVFSQWGQRFPESGFWRKQMFQRIGKEACWLASLSLDEGNIERYIVCLEFAEQVYPQIYKSGYWWKLRAKAFLGQNFCMRVLPVWRRLRDTRNTFLKHRAPESIQPARIIGWWPGSTEEKE